MQVRASVEERVRAALVRAENLEHELEAVRVQHLEEMEVGQTGSWNLVVMHNRNNRSAAQGRAMLHQR
jgi:hypothetical protein